MYMRSIKRFLILGAVVLGGLLLSGSRPATPVQPSVQWGNFRGTYTFGIYSKTHEFQEDAYGSTFLDDEELQWYGHGTIDLAIPYNLQSTATVLNLNVNIYQDANATMTGNGGNCNWQDSIMANGKFGKSWTFFDRKAWTWDSSVIWNKITSYHIINQASSGSFQACKSFGSKLAISQKVKVVEKVTRTIDLIRFTIAAFSDFDISGKCSFPTWEGTFPTTYGKAEHVTDNCTWHVFRVESKEWKNPLLRGQ
jgi:hypothetical protein